MIQIISVGSQTTLAQYGLGESLGPASIELPTRVYKHPDHLKEGNYFKSSGEEKDAIYPIVGGRIENLAALNYLIKLIYKSVTKPIPSYIQPALLVLSSGQWTRPQIESITQYAFENIQVPGFAIVSTALAATFAYALQDALVIDIGKDKTEITAILEFSVVENAQKSIPLGGDSVTNEIVKLLPNLTLEQVEDLKKSPIYEVLSEDDTKNSWFGLNATADGENNEDNEEEDGVVDVAAIVASGRAREILAEREKAKQNAAEANKKAEPPNMDRELNTFIDREGRSVEVGKQRFHGTEELVDRLTYAVGEVIKNVDQVNRRQDIWDNIIIIGRGSKIKGIKEAIFVNLQARFLISRPTTYSELPSTLNTGYNTPNNNGGTPAFSSHAAQQLLHQGHGQSPTSIRLAKMAEYFPEWKGHGWEDAAFLGGEIAAKQIFTTSVDGTYVTRNDYNEVGPTSIWDV